MLDLVVGEKKNPTAANQLINLLLEAPYTGTLYIGYPILSTADDTVVVDALLVARERGLVIFDLNEVSEETAERQNDLHAAVQRRLLGYKSLRSGRGLAFEINILTFSPDQQSVDVGVNGLLVANPKTFDQVLRTLEPIGPEVFASLNAAVERVTTIKPTRKRLSVKKTNSRGAILKEIEKQIANLDQWQKKAAIESPEGVQRIRGLAGSGKTIVLALKAAMLHARNPEWTIALTFHTRSLYQQFKDLVRRFTYEHANDEPDWERLRIIHSWGSSRASGVYSEIARAVEFDPRDFAYAKNHFGQSSAFEGVCRELLHHVKQKKSVPQLYDAVLIDEAQDLPQPFFELVYHVTREPKRIVYAYDELQNLGTYSIFPPSELFGKNAQGDPNVPVLENLPGKPSQDLVLPVCYRNTPWALTVAHALGLGIYREEGIVQFFEEQHLWEEVGYEVLQGKVKLDNHVVLRRRPDSAPKYFETLVTPDDAVLVKCFDNSEKQLEWVAKSIQKNLDEDELEIDDILVIFPEPRTVANEAARLIHFLDDKDIASHIVGITNSRDIVFTPETLALSGIYRAKGNEAPMVYVLNSEYCAAGPELSRLRNILFTAITRSRAWVRIFGCGKQMETLEVEIKKLVDNNYKLDFVVPTAEELTRIRKIHRELTEDERAKVKKLEKQGAEFLESLLSGEVEVEHLSKDVQKKLREFLAGKKQA